MTHDLRQEALELLDTTRRFPCDYDISVVALNTEDVARAVRTAVESGLSAPLPDSAYTCHRSSAGRYASHRVTVPCRTAEEVMLLFERVRAVPGVVTVL